jgi:hypothetical protein
MGRRIDISIVLGALAGVAVLAPGILAGATAQAADFAIPDGDVAALAAAIETANANGEDNTITLAASGTYSTMAPAVAPGAGGNTGLPLITGRIAATQLPSFRRPAFRGGYCLTVSASGKAAQTLAPAISVE